MIKKTLLSSLLTLSCLLGSAPAQAIGAGFQFGWYDGEAEEEFSGRDDLGVRHREFGFALDTARRWHPFSYRLHLAVLSGSLDGFDYAGASATHTLAVRLNDHLGHRLWIGPSVSVTRYEVDGLSSGHEEAFSLGVRGGVDVYLNDQIDLGVELGLRRIEYDQDPPGGDLEYETYEGSLSLVMLFGKF